MPFTTHVLAGNRDEDLKHPINIETGLRRVPSSKSAATPPSPALSFHRPHIRLTTPPGRTPSCGGALQTLRCSCTPRHTAHQMGGGASSPASSNAQATWQDVYPPAPNRGLSCIYCPSCCCMLHFERVLQASALMDQGREGGEENDAAAAPSPPLPPAPPESSAAAPQ